MFLTLNAIEVLLAPGSACAPCGQESRVKLRLSSSYDRQNVALVGSYGLRACDTSGIRNHFRSHV
jgi:hypothetical protein